jgi:hypothetical protein
MAQLKTTGIAVNCTMAIAVDPDTDQIKDFASASVTSTMTTTGVTVGAQNWKGTSRKFAQLGASANFIAFGANLPAFVLNAAGQARTVVWIGEAAGGVPRVFGEDSSRYIAGNNIGLGGSTHPALVMTTPFTGGQAAPAAGDKRIFGFTMLHGTRCEAWYALESASAVGKSANLTNLSGVNQTWNLNYVGRRDDSTTQQADKLHLVAIFNAELSQSDWDALLTDWFGTLFESPAGMSGSVALDNLVASGSMASTASEVSGGVTLDDAVAGGDILSSASALSGGPALDPLVASGSLGQAPGVLTVPQLKNWSGQLLISQLVENVVVIRMSDRAVVAAFTNQTTHASTGDLALSSVALVPGTLCMVVGFNADGSARFARPITVV